MPHLKRKDNGHLMRTASGHLSFGCPGGVSVLGIAPKIVLDVDGYPALLYVTYNPPYGGVPNFIRANSADGSGLWRAPQSVLAATDFEEAGVDKYRFYAYGGKLDLTATPPDSFTAADRVVNYGRVLTTGAILQEVADDTAATSFSRANTDIIQTGAGGNNARQFVLLANGNIGLQVTGNAPVSGWYYSDDADGLTFNGPITGGANREIKIVNGVPVHVVNGGASNDVSTITYGDDANGSSFSAGPTATLLINYTDIDGDMGAVCDIGGALTFFRFALTDPTVGTGVVIPTNWGSGATSEGLQQYADNVRSAAITYVPDSGSGTIYVHWTVASYEYFYGPVENRLTPTHGIYTYPYYPLLAIKLIVYESTSTDGGTTWSEPAIYAEETVTTTDNKWFIGLYSTTDGTDVYVAWWWERQGNMYLNGNLVQE